MDQCSYKCTFGAVSIFYGADHTFSLALQHNVWLHFVLLNQWAKFYWNGECTNIYKSKFFYWNNKKYIKIHNMQTLSSMTWTLIIKQYLTGLTVHNHHDGLFITAEDGNDAWNIKMYTLTHHRKTWGMNKCSVSYSVPLCISSVYILLLQSGFVQPFTLTDGQHSLPLSGQRSFHSQCQTVDSLHYHHG